MPANLQAGDKVNVICTDSKYYEESVVDKFKSNLLLSIQMYNISLLHKYN